MTPDPVPLDDQPRCFGAMFAPDRPMCVDCSFAAACKAPSARWTPRLSLEEAYEEKYAALFAVVPQDLASTYRSLYEQVFGEHLVPAQVKSKQAVSAFAWVEAYCTENDIDAALWMRAQMIGMQAGIVAKKNRGDRFARFLPNMLRGERAKYRYDTHLLKIGLQHQAASLSSVPMMSEFNKVIEFVADVEADLLAIMARSWSMGNRLTLKETITLCDPAMEWRYAVGMVPDLPNATTNQKWVLRKVSAVAVLKGTINAAAEWRTTLPSHLSYREPFSREGYAALIARLFPFTPVQATNRLSRTTAVYGY